MCDEAVCERWCVTWAAERDEEEAEEERDTDTEPKTRTLNETDLSRLQSNDHGVHCPAASLLVTSEREKKRRVLRCVS